MTPNLTNLANKLDEAVAAAGLVDADQQAAAAQLKTAQDALSAEQATSATLRLEIDNLNGQVASLSAPVVFDFLESETWLLAAGTVANSAGVKTPVTAHQNPAGLHFANRQIIPGGPFGDAYWYLKLGLFPLLKRFRQEGSFCFPAAADAGASQAVEFDLQQCIGGMCWNPAFQMDYAEGLLRYWDKGSQHWIPTGVTIKRPSPGTWINVAWDSHRDDSTVYYDAATINGVKQPIKNVSFPALKNGLSDMLNYGFQLDGNSAGAAYTVLINRFRLTGWTA